MKKKVLSILLTFCMFVSFAPTTVWAVQDSTKNAAKTNFGLTNEKLNYVYLNDQGAYKAMVTTNYPHFINADSGIYHLHGNLQITKDINVFRHSPNNIEVKSGGTVKLLFDGTLDGSEGLIWNYSKLKDKNLSEEYSMIKIKNGKENKATNVEIHFAGKCTISAPIYNAVVHSYGNYSNLTIVLHDDCDVTLTGGSLAAAVGGTCEDEGRNITITTDGKYDTNGNRISYKANGKLTCIGGGQAAGIGSSYLRNADNITINSGTVIAKGGNGAAGIGSGAYFWNSKYQTKSKASNIRINGGEVYATGGDSAAGIGSGDGNNAENIFITGGVVTAIGGDYAAAVGSGSRGTAENITVSGGKITATAGKGGAGIGSGYSGTAGNITVSGGKVKVILKGKYNAFPIGRGYKASGSSGECKNNMLKVHDDTKVSFDTTLSNGSTNKNVYYSLDSLDMSKEFGFYIDENGYALNNVEINFESCTDHNLKWFPTLKYQYCSNCQSVKTYDDVAPTISGIDDSVLFGSWVNFKADDAGQGPSRDITHNYKVGDEERSVLFKSVPYKETGISQVTVSTYTYDANKKTHSVLTGEETLTETDNNNGKKSYQFRGANTNTEYQNFQKAQTNDEKLAALKMQRITVTDNAGNKVKYDVYAILAHRVECYIGSKKQIIDKTNNRDYLNVIDGGNIKLTFLQGDSSANLGYQHYYYVTVNGTRIPTTEDNVYEFKNVKNDLEVHFDPKFDETVPFLAIKINNDSYDSTQSGNDDLSKCKKLNTAAAVTISSRDVAKDDEPTSGIMESSLEYLISEKPLTTEELENAAGWEKYNGEFKLPDSKTSIVYARVRDIAQNVTYAASVPYLPDETAPTINGLQQDKIYCGEVSFSVSDSNGIAEVKAGKDILTPDNNGKYTLAAGTGKVTVIVTDKAKNSTSVTVTVNAGHKSEEDDGDCTTAVKCSVCGNDVISAKSSHTYGNDWKANRPEATHYRTCQNDGCKVQEIKDCHGGTATCTEQAICDDCKVRYGKLDADNHTGEKQWVQTAEQHSQIWSCCKEVTVPYESHEWKDGVCTECGYACKHSGGTATCTEQAICEICGESYGELNADNHTGEKQWIQTAEQHSQRWSCCGKVEIPKESHRWENGICTECGYKCQHSGGTATCTEQAICEICGESYGELNADNHTGEKQWIQTAEQHSQRWSCCGKVEIPNESHKWENGTCTECGCSCRHNGGTATCTEQAICKTCGESYGELNADNHTGEKQWIQTAEQHSQHWSCCGKVEIPNESHKWENGTCTECGYKCQHYGGIATCTEQAICTICGEQYGDILPHNYSTDWSIGDTTHWHGCTVCGAKSDEAEHIFDNDCDTTCNICGAERDVVHSYKDEWSVDENNHWHECSLCGAKKDDEMHIVGPAATETTPQTCTVCGYIIHPSLGHSHSYTVKSTDAKYLKSAATCTDKATYFYSCLCGEKGTEYFEYGDMLEHIDKDNDHKCDVCNKILSKCIDNNKDHKCDICNNTLSKCVDANKDHKCDICGKILSNHFGGTSTCTDKAVCLICGKGYGEMNPNNHPNLQHVDAKAAAVDTEGNIEYWYCKDCDKYFADKDGNKEISKADTVIAGLTKTDDNAQSPKTGDNGNMALWLALLLLSSGTVVVTTVISKKKKHNQ